MRCELLGFQKHRIDFAVMADIGGKRLTRCREDFIGCGQSPVAGGEQVVEQCIFSGHIHAYSSPSRVRLTATIVLSLDAILDGASTRLHGLHQYRHIAGLVLVS